MGGFGSGNHGSGGGTVNHHRSIDVRRFQREKLLQPGDFGWQWSNDGGRQASIIVHCQADSLVLEYRLRLPGVDWQRIEEAIPLDSTPCHLGGHRHWFRCPGEGCGRRVAKLYLGERYFVCRHCLKLVYPSQRESVIDRISRRTGKIRERLGWEAGLLNGHGPKPKWMRWRTYERLMDQHDELVAHFYQNVAKRLKFSVRTEL
ncbi:MAG: hypothetical protein H6R07_526 [Proteobacteria bacterium]|nr:hypothetical protein [Pseudomonadota bacterium]